MVKCNFKNCLNGRDFKLVVKSTLENSILAKKSEKGTSPDFWSKETDLEFFVLFYCLRPT